MPSPLSLPLQSLTVRACLVSALLLTGPRAPTVGRKRVALGGPFLSLVLYSLVFCLDTPSAAALAKAAIAALQQRATVELIPQVLVATTALLSVSPPAQHATA